MKPYYSEAGITIYHGECREVMPSLNTVFDIVFTSPPYNLGGEPWPHLGNWKQGDFASSNSKWRNGSNAASGVQYASHDDAMPHEQYVDWQRGVLSQCWKMIGESGAIYYNHKPRVIGARLWTPLELNPGITLRQIIIWARSGGLNFNPTAYVPTHEWILLFAKEAFRLKSRGASGVGDVWNVTQESRSSHPAPFPISLPARAMESSGARSVLDPHCGSGTTLVAAKQAGVEAIGIEINESYCEIAANRLRQGVLFGSEVA